jgi:hypothetical protein
MRKFVPMKKALFFVVLSLFATIDAFSQCAMCKSVVESNIEGGSSIGAGINDGILYLMVMPYIALAIVALVWSKYNKRQKA